MIQFLFFFGVAAGVYLFFCIVQAIRNIYFHPLSYIPGPKLWIAFPFLRHLTAIRGLLDSNMCRFHDKYGQTVRFGPDEVSFINAQAWRDIYQRQPEQLQRFIVPAFRYPYDIFNADDADHTRFRRVMAPAFSAKGLQAQEPLLRGYIDQLISVLGEAAESKSPTNMVKWYNLTTFDIIGDLAFGQSFGGLESKEYHFVIEYLFKSYKWLTYLEAATAYPVICNMIMRMLPNSVKEAGARRIEHAEATVAKRVENKSLHGRGDFMDSMTKNEGQKDGLNRTELVANACNLIVAGSETTATLMSGLTYYLVNNRAALETVTAEVRSAFKDDSEINFTTATARLPYLLACINEAFRLYPPVPTGLQRLAPPTAPVTISGYEIAAKVNKHIRTTSTGPLLIIFSDQGFCSPPSCILFIYQLP